MYIRLVQSKRATFGKWPDWSYGYCHVAESLSFPTVHHSSPKSDFQGRYNGSCEAGATSLYGFLVHEKNS